MVRFSSEDFETSTIAFSDFRGSKGSIVRLKIQDFMTYQDVEMHAGPNVNLVVGPNGTGKSTIVCAICLALAGKPRILGRASTLKEYIRHGATTATVEVELFNPGGKANWIIKRVIYETGSGATSDWFLNNMKTNQNAIEKLMEALNIQLDNLCQFLPQDRVQDFARMDKINLLKSTEKSIDTNDGNHLGAKHERLIEIQDKIKMMELKLKQQEEKLRIETQHNNRLEQDVRNFQARERIKEEIHALEGKKLWLQYERAMREFTELQARYEELNARKNKEESVLVPLTREIEAMNDKLADYRVELNNLRTQSSNVIETYRRQFRDASDRADADVQRITAEIESSEKNERDRMRRLESLREKLAAQHQELSDFLRKGPIVDETTFKDQVKHFDEQLSMVHKKIVEIDGMNDMATNNIRMASVKLQSVEKELRTMSEFRSSRLTYLQRRCPDVYKAVEFFTHEENVRAAGFQGTLHEPLILNIGVKELSYGKIAERCMPSSDMIAFFVTHKDDVPRLLDQAKMHNLGKISAIYHEVPPTFRMPPPSQYSDEEIRRYGFEKRLIELIEASEYYMSYLVKTIRPQDILIGNEYTDGYLNEIMQNTDIRSFYTSQKSFMIRKSHYRQEKNFIVSNLYEAQIFTDKINASERVKLEKIEQTIRQEIDSLQSQIESRKPAKTELSAQRQTLEAEKNVLKQRIEYKRQLDTKIAGSERQIMETEAEKTDLQTLRQECTRKILDARKKQERALGKFIDALFRVAENWYDVLVLKQKINLFQNNVVTKQNKMEQARVSINNYVNEIKVLESQKKVVADTVKRHKMDAQAKTGLKQPPDEVHYGHLEEDRVQADIVSLRAQLNFLPEPDEKNLQAYQARKKTIEELEVAKDETERDLNEFQEELKESKEAWLEPLKQLIYKINLNFGDFFQKINCVGEISLDQGEDDNDFAKYGVKIMVKFRTSEPLTELCGWKQSGGERAITTALYILALQELTKVPFRVIDEINQGMDAKNESRFFHLLCSLAKGTDTPQYFLLTPKMLPPVEYPDNVKFHIILNGPHVRVDPRYAVDWTRWGGDSDEDAEDSSEEED